MHVNYLITYEGKNAYLFGVSPTFLYFCRQMMKRQNTLLYIFLLPCVLLLGTLSSCRDSYPKELVQADSLLLRGEYHDVDSLLAVYDANASSRKSVQMYRHLQGREDDVINVGGYKVAPTEVEDAALSFPGLCDCICLPVPHPITGTALRLLVQMADGVTLNKRQLALHLKSRLETYKVPLLYEQVATIRRTFNGKLDRKSYR